MSQRSRLEKSHDHTRLWGVVQGDGQTHTNLHCKKNWAIECCTHGHTNTHSTNAGVRERPSVRTYHLDAALSHSMRTLDKLGHTPRAEATRCVDGGRRGGGHARHTDTEMASEGGQRHKTHNNTRRAIDTNTLQLFFCIVELSLERFWQI